MEKEGLSSGDAAEEFADRRAACVLVWTGALAAGGGERAVPPSPSFLFVCSLPPCRMQRESANGEASCRLASGPSAGSHWPW